ncbi:hypothetical protein NARC_220031 [Candidatus Nitrosocosmicus arcticus]|uniref:Uncharacterized protein n=1 Tax=Candidatus Nitrosocosmicus arcticus TaxID=2035267 RepID=A0A557SR24_9ARCH|nr:hypothetical protein NARC_220031 [Candidatus Nitrosocosmicus arcticus]
MSWMRSTYNQKNININLVLRFIIKMISKPPIGRYNQDMANVFDILNIRIKNDCQIDNSLK